MDDLTKLDVVLKEMQARRIKIDAERQTAEKKISPVRERMRKTVENLQSEYHTNEKKILEVIDRNRGFFEQNRIIRGIFGSFGLIKSSGRVRVKNEKEKERDIAERFHKSGRLRKYVRTRYELDRNAILERARAGKLDAEILQAGIEIQTGLIPFVKVHIPKDVNLRREQNKLEQTNGVSEVQE